MPFIRLSDNYVDHPKIEPLTDGAFRLWHHALAYCRRHQTDGLIPKATMLAFACYKPKRLGELIAPTVPGRPPLIAILHGFGFKLHDYLQWNQSKEEENEHRFDAKLRMKNLRDSRRSLEIPPIEPPCSRERSANVATVPQRVTNTNVLDMDKEEILEKKSVAPMLRGAVRPLGDLVDPEIASRAGCLLERYAELFYQHRRGARYHARPHLDFPKACEIVTTWTDDARLEKLAVLILTTDDEWIARTDRGFAVFAAKATWADEKLAAWEHEHGVTV